MIDIEYNSFEVAENKGAFSAKVVKKSTQYLPEGEVLIRVRFAGLNYKDALSTFGHKGITRSYPHTPGVDAAGEVVFDSSNSFKEGAQVICTSFDLGMNTSGGFGEYIRVPSSWVIPLPANISLYESMILGTAAYTAALALYKMELMGQQPEMGKIVVTGASGGVGSLAVKLLSGRGYQVAASTGKTDAHEYLTSLGAYEIISREAVNDTSNKPLLSKQWAGAIDNVGGNTLSTLLKGCDRNGSVASIGLVGSPLFESSVYPFILNGVNLLGVDSAETPLFLRKKIWSLLAADWKINDLSSMGTTIDMNELPTHLERIKAGKSKGRIVLKHS